MKQDRLSKITIRGYKSIAYDNPVTLNLQDVTLLIGANGAGKSNILSFFKLLGFMMNGALQRYVEQEGTSNALLHYGVKVTPQLSCELVYQDEQRTNTYRFTLAHATEGRLLIDDEKVFSNCGRTSDDVQGIASSYNYRESDLLKSTADKTIRIRENLLQTKFYQFHDSSSNGPLRQASQVDTPNYLQTQATNLAAFLLFLKENYPVEFRKIEEHVRFVVPNFREFYLVPNKGYVSLKWYDTSGNDYVLTADQLSDGSIRFIALATLLLQPQETIARIIILDEPELGLHPMAIDALAHLIEDASLKSQILVSTQSKELIDYFEPQNIAVVEMAEDSHTTTVQQLDNEALSSWLENYTLSELWDKNVLGGRP